METFSVIRKSFTNKKGDTVYSYRYSDTDEIIIKESKKKYDLCCVDDVDISDKTDRKRIVRSFGTSCMTPSNIRYMINPKPLKITED